MKLSSTINDGIIQTLNRLCGATVNTYPFKAKISDLNDALDKYFKLAFDSGSEWSFDDINQTSPPIDVQSIVSGTNRYKVGTFTEKIMNLIKLEILDTDGKGVELIPEHINHLGESFQEAYLNTTDVTGTPSHYCKYGDFIYLRPTPDYSEADGLKAYFNRPASKFEFVSCSIANTTGIVTAVAHGLAIGDTVIFETDGTLNTGVTADTQYYVIAGSFTADTFTVSLTSGGAAITVSSTGSGCHFLKTSKEPGIPVIHHLYLVRKAALAYLSYINSPKLGFLPQQVMQDEREIKEYFGQRNRDIRQVMTTEDISYR